MDLYRIKPKKCLRWPAALNPPPKELRERLTPRGIQAWSFNHPAFRSQEAGFVVDMDSPGEAFFCRDDARNLEPVPASERDAALAKLKEQGPITWQPAIDYLEERGLLREAKRPAEEAPKTVKTETEDGLEVEGCELSKMKSAPLKAVCDALELPHGKVAEMREAIQAALECEPDAVVAMLPDGTVGLVGDPEEVED